MHLETPVAVVAVEGAAAVVEMVYGAMVDDDGGANGGASSGAIHVGPYGDDPSA